MTPEVPSNYCSQCGRPTPADEMVRFGDLQVCPNCKNSYTQKLREGVAPGGFVRYGGFWLRFVGMLIDGIIMAIPIGILQTVLLGMLGMSLVQNPPDPNAPPEEMFQAMAPFFAAIGFTSLLGMGLGCLYETVFLVKYGATPGKMAIGVKVVRPDGSKLEVGRAIGRYFSKLLSAIILYIGYIMAGFDSEKRALHDMICDTRVVKTRG
jgi:uncharacterized RDD family membrane protein YckC